MPNKAYLDVTVKNGNSFLPAYVRASSYNVIPDSTVTNSEHAIQNKIGQATSTSSNLDGVIHTIEQGIIAAVNEAEGNTVKLGSLTIPNTGWTESATGSEIWSVNAASVSGTITSGSRIDIQPSPQQIKTLMDAGCISLQASNYNRTVKLYIIGSNPNTSLTSSITNVQISITETNG